MQTCGRCANGYVNYAAVPITNAGPDLNINYNYDWQWRVGRATNYGALPQGLSLELPHTC